MKTKMVTVRRRRVDGTRRACRVLAIGALGGLALASCAPAPPPPPPRPPVVTPAPEPPKPPPPPPLAEVHWAPESSDAEGVTLGGAVSGGEDTVDGRGDGSAPRSVDAAVVSVTCSSAKIGRAQVIGEHASLRLEAAEIATAVQCRGLKVTLTHASQSTSTVVPFDLTMQLAANVAGGIGISRTTNSPDMVLSIPGSSASSRLAIGNESYVARKVGGGNAEFLVPILALVKAALHRQHAIASTGLKPIDYTPALAIAGQSVPAEGPAEPAPAH